MAVLISDGQLHLALFLVDGMRWSVTACSIPSCMFLFFICPYERERERDLDVTTYICKQIVDKKKGKIDRISDTENKIIGR